MRFFLTFDKELLAKLHEQAGKNALKSVQVPSLKVICSEDIAPQNHGRILHTFYWTKTRICTDLLFASVSQICKN